MCKPKFQLKPKKWLLVATCALFAPISMAEVQSEFDPREALKTVDTYRSESRSVKISSTVRAYKGNDLTHTKYYDVYSSTDKQSLVVFKSVAEKGQKVLMKGNDYWMFMPRSRRPIRITPMQKLLGEASLGDISTLSWSQDYSVQHLNDEGEDWSFELKADSPKMSYQKILLSVSKSDFFPKQAELFLRSGKHAKTAQFERGERNGKLKVVAMALYDEMKKGQKTVIAYDSIQPINVPKKLFNPQILIRSDLDKLLTE